MKVFGDLENQLIDLCHQCPPDFEAIKAKIAEGADVNAYDCYGEEVKHSVLAEVIHNFGYAEDKDFEKYGCQHLTEVIQIFLDAGFDVRLDEGRYGAMALSNLKFCYTDKHILDAANLLFGAGADPSILPYLGEPPSETVYEIIRFDASFREHEGDTDDAAILFELADLIKRHMLENCEEGHNG